MTKTTASIFTGGGLVEIGARAAGFVPLWGIEIDDEIAQVARVNGLHVLTDDVRYADPSVLQRPDHLHASPPCPSFSQAKKGGKETREDVELAQATVRFIETLKPRTFSLENVSMYRKSESWRLIQNALDRLGYWTQTHNHLNAADFGVPQTRKRMFVRAIRGGFLPPLPQPVPWRGWYQAIEDLLPDLPDSEFAPWQLARMPKELLSSFVMSGSGNTNFADAHPGKGCRYEGEPMHTVTCQDGGGTWPKAFLATSQYAQPSGHPDRQCQTRNPDEPSPTVTASTKSDWRAFIVDGANTRGDDRLITTRKDGEPMFTVSAQSLTKNPIRAAVPGRVVRMTPRALARFQSIPDDYILPDNATLAVRIIGNSVPPLWAERLLEGFV